MTPENSGRDIESTHPDKYTVEYISSENVLRVTVHIVEVQFECVYNKITVDVGEDKDGRIALDFLSGDQHMVLKDEVNDEFLIVFSLSPSVMFSSHDIEVESTPRPGEIRIDIPMPRGIRKGHSRYGEETWSRPRNPDREGSTFEKKPWSGPQYPNQDNPAPELPADLTIDINADVINGRGWSEYIELVNPTYFEKKVLRELMTYQIESQFHDRDHEPSPNELNGVLNVVGKMLSEEIRSSGANDV